MKTKILLGIIIMLAAYSSLFAQDTQISQNTQSNDIKTDNKPKISFRGRLLNDFTVSELGAEKAKGYYKIEDLRLGLRVNYKEFTLTGDFGINQQKISIKDLLLKYTKTGKSIWTIGNAYEPFSMEMQTSTISTNFHTFAPSVVAIANGRRFGITHHLNLEQHYWALGGYLDSDINSWHTSLSQSFAATTRYVFRSKEDNSTFYHIGAAASLRSPDNDKSNDSYQVISQSNNGVTSIFGEKLLSNKITNSQLQVKSNIEFLVMWDKARLQGEYLHSYVDRNNGLKGNHSYGFYIQASYLILGKGFAYDRSTAVIGSPKAGALELTLRYDQVTMGKTESTPIKNMRDVSLGLNYYANKYMAVKLNGSYVFDIQNGNTFFGSNYFIAQLRLQVAI